MKGLFCGVDSIRIWNMSRAASLLKLRFCATGRPDVILKPGEVIIAKVCHYGGAHPVASRLAFGREKESQVYSNGFTECVDDDMLRIIDSK